MKSPAAKTIIYAASCAGAGLARAVLAGLLCALCAALTGPAASAEATACAPGASRDSYIVADGDVLSIGNSLTSRYVVITNGLAEPSAVVNKVAGKTLKSAEEFSLTLADGRRVSSSEFVYAGRIPQEFDGGRCKITLSYYNEALSIDAQVVFWVLPYSNLVRKYVRLRSSSQGAVYVESVTVEHFTSAGEAGSGGLGQPVYLEGAFFAGLEFPAGRNTAGAGGAAVSHYPGWTLGREWLKSKTAVVGVSNDGENRRFFMQYANSIARGGAPFSVWSGGPATPGAGKGNKTILSFGNIDEALAGPDEPTQPGSLLRTEAFADAAIASLEAAGAANPGAALVVDSYRWISPWWLPYIDSVRIDKRDSGVEADTPYTDIEDSATTRDDAALFRLFNDEHIQFPLWAIMSRGVFDGRKDFPSSDDLEMFTAADNAMARFGRGAAAHEIYFSQDGEGGDRAALFEDLTRWSESRSGLFASGSMQGWNPSWGSPYWFQFADGVSDLISIRYPGFLPTSIRLKLSSPQCIVRMTYPYQKWLPARQVSAEGFIDYDLPGHGVVVLQSEPASSLRRPAIMGVRSRITRQTDTETEYELSGMPGNIAFNIISNAAVSEVTLNGAPLVSDEKGYYHGRLEKLSADYDQAPVDSSAFEDHDYFKVKIDTTTSATTEIADLKHIMIVTAASPAAPSRATINGAATEAVSTGRGWSVFEFPLGYGSATQHIEFTPESIAASPFATATITVDLITTGFIKAATGSLIVKHAPSPADDAPMPPAPMQNFIRYLKPEFFHLKPSLADIVSLRAYPADKSFAPSAAKIHIRLAGSKPGGGASISLNGSKPTLLPSNSFPYDRMEDFVIDVPAGQLGAVRKENYVVIHADAGGAIRFSELAISAQLPDGSWLNTPYDNEVQYSADFSSAQEGAAFAGESRPTRLSFP